MANVLIIVKSYLTHDRQNALCIERVADCLKTYGHEIDYLSWEQKDNDVRDNNVYAVFEPEHIRGIRSMLRKATKIINTPLNSMTLVDQLYLTLKKLIKIKDYSTVIAVINPAEGAEALYRVKKEIPNLNAILYEIDPNSNRYKLCDKISEKIWRIRSAAWEKKIYGSFNHIIHMQTHKKHYSSTEFKAFKNKTIYLDIPNFIPHEKQELKHNNILKFLYCGAFYPKLREPYYMFSFFDELYKRQNLLLDIYTGNSMRDELTIESKKRDYISIHNEVAQKELDNIIILSDVLVSIGNANSDFLPSKTLMYMSTGKPIIHFYSDDEDVSLKYFKNYPAVLTIKDTNDLDSSIEECIEFLKKLKTLESIDPSYMIQYIYKNTPEYSAKIINGLIK